uniref:Uncharacterized protein n=1 Tax=Anguilla anguilla TaxID=7936 RepID=A0A0E9SCN2_ANGAN
MWTGNIQISLCRALGTTNN